MSMTSSAVALRRLLSQTLSSGWGASPNSPHCRGAAPGLMGAPGAESLTSYNVSSGTSSPSSLDTWDLPPGGDGFPAAPHLPAWYQWRPKGCPVTSDKYSASLANFLTSL